MYLFHMENYLVLVLILASGLTAGDHITPVENEVTSTEGQSVTLNCTYDTSSEYPLLYWYRHHPNQAPQFILYKGAKSYSDLEEIPDDRYQSTTSVTSTKLVIQQLTLSDTGFYYCALRDMGTVGVVGKLTFGKAIRLTVNSNKSPVRPTLSILTPGGTEGGSPEVCLAAGFLPKDEVMNLTQVKKGPLSHRTITAALSSSNTFYYAGYSEDGIENCEMMNVKAERTKSTSDDDGTKSTSDNDPTKGSDIAVPTSVVCKDEEPPSDQTDTNYPNYTKVNFTSLVVYGLRVLFAKAVAFNVLFTVKALVF